MAMHETIEKVYADLVAHSSESWKKFGVGFTNRTRLATPGCSNGQHVTILIWRRYLSTHPKSDVRPCEFARAGVFLPVTKLRLLPVSGVFAKHRLPLNRTHTNSPSLPQFAKRC